MHELELNLGPVLQVIEKISLNCSIWHFKFSSMYNFIPFKLPSISSNLSWKVSPEVHILSGILFYLNLTN